MVNVVLVMESNVDIIVEKVNAKIAKMTIGPLEENSEITLVVL